jgi:hypothetical protein
MNLPPFPILPLTPEERILWIDWGERVAAAERERAASLVPTNWLDPMLHGLSDVPAGVPQVERLCRRLAAAIRKGNQQEGK